MLNKLKNMFKTDNSISVLSPLKGESVPLSKVNDPVFADEILGKGVGIIPSEQRIVAPFDGTVTVVIETGHAVSLVSESGIEMLIHVGLDTTKLKGEFFKPLVKQGDKVKAGDVILEFEMDKIKEKGFDMITPVVICNAGNYEAVEGVFGKVNEMQSIIKITK